MRAFRTKSGSKIYAIAIDENQRRVLIEALTKAQRETDLYEKLRRDSKGTGNYNKALGLRHFVDLLKSLR